MKGTHILPHDHPIPNEMASRIATKLMETAARILNCVGRTQVCARHGLCSDDSRLATAAQTPFRICAKTTASSAASQSNDHICTKALIH